MKDSSSGSTCNILQQLLRNYFEVSMKVRQYHWNIVWNNFIEDHRFLDEIKDNLDWHIDMVAEMIRQKDMSPDISKSIEMSKIQLQPWSIVNSASVFNDLLNDYITLCWATNKAITTIEDTCDCQDIPANLEMILADLNKYRWFISSKTK